MGGGGVVGLCYEQSRAHRVINNHNQKPQSKTKTPTHLGRLRGARQHRGGDAAAAAAAEGPAEVAQLGQHALAQGAGHRQQLPKEARAVGRDAGEPLWCCSCCCGGGG